ncbi:MAG: hypothetical protein Q4C00_07310 [Bacillota bacterium]|nr:hypothetical protein [Bacillota bacterium]
MFTDKLKLTTGDKKKLSCLLLLAALAVFLLIAAGLLEGDNTVSEGGEEKIQTTQTSKEDVEGKLSAILSGIEGVGRVSVAVEYDSSGIKEYAYNEEVSESASGGEGDLTTETTTRREMVLINGDNEGVLITDTPGEIVGVLVVAQGAHRAEVREKIQNAVVTCLDLGANRVAIYSMEE